MAETVQLISNYGLSIFLSGCFIYQYFKAQNYNISREEKLYSLIDILSKELPEINKNIEDVKDEVTNLKEKLKFNNQEGVAHERFKR